MSVQIKLVNDPIGQKIRTQGINAQAKVKEAARLAMEEARERILVAGRDDMRAGGNFGSQRWQTSLQGDFINESGNRLVLRIFHRVFFWRVFEYGATIRGKPLLWIPLPWNPLKVRARDFPGKLFRVDREGKNPLLMQNAGGKATALYVGVRQVRLRRRFHLRPIIRRVAKQMPFLFKKWMRLLNKRR